MSETIARRTALRLVGGTVIAASASGAAGATEAEQIAEMLADWRRLVDWCNGSGPGDRELKDCPEWDELLELEAELGAMEPATRAGAEAQLRFARAFADQWHTFEENGESAFRNALAALDRLAGGATHG